MYKLFSNIKRFYEIFGEELGANPCPRLSKMTADNLYDVQFDINEALEAYEGLGIDEMETWLNQLNAQITTYRERAKGNCVVVAIALFVVLVVAVGCNIQREPKVEVETQPHTQYTAYGRYYTNGTVITNDGNEWAYTTDTISDKTPYDTMPVWVGFDDNGTPDRVEDDVILGLVYDRNTAIYDDLETALSDKFELTRDGNNIHIGGIK